ncbi:CPBP family intramembrane glutamic endopeptidase [Paenisporosarcina sp. TG20]|uniref:CPBP family intramembrane glutamic endopeptidase n=1 Tax=Paenisporosarcina sp. TG20 TaxID=1211706 RepID=UPI0003082B3B|nr:CPBP family intramembrane glutamic endopeptidase [Paenisporosarcina sp. TG20]
MKNIIYLFGPTILIFIGLSYLESIPITFLLFYGWLFFVPFISYSKRLTLKEMFLDSIKKGFGLKPILIGLISGIISGVSIYISVDLLQGHIFDINPLSDRLNQWGFNGAKVWGFILVLAFINPILEEWYWREFMFKKYLATGVAKSIFITSTFYSLYHLLILLPLFGTPFSLLAILPVFFAGLLWGYLRYIFSSIIAPVISHALADLGIILVYLHFFM